MLRDGLADLRRRPGSARPLATLISPTMSDTRWIAGHDLAASCCPACRPARCPLDALDAGADQGLDLACGFGAALRQAAHLGGHDRKAAALLAGTRGFHRRVQRQDVGLEGDAVDGADDVGDACGCCR
jgi:hypothetical protein